MSPWAEFQQWLIDKNNSELSNEVSKVINIRNSLIMFCYMENTTIFLNEYFNNFNSMKLNQSETFNFLKTICLKNNVSRHKFSFIKQDKKDKIINNVRTKIPYLKKEEVKYFLDLIKGTEEEEEILECLGLQKIKKKRLTKKQLNELEKMSNYQSEKLTWEDWKNKFKGV